MKTNQFAEMLDDKNFFDLKKMEYKHGKQDVADMVEALSLIGYKKVGLFDFHQNECVYLPSHSEVNTAVIKKLVQNVLPKENFSRAALAGEIVSTLRIENIKTSRETARRIVAGFAPISEQEQKAFDIKKGLEFILDINNKITEQNLHTLYQLAVGNNLKGQDKLKEGSFYRDDTVYVVGDKTYHEGLDAKLLPEYMAKFLEFINQKDDIPELVKACIIHFYFAYLHPYFDGNGRTARLLQLWYLVQNEFCGTMFYSFSQYIDADKSKYYKSFSLVENNFEVSQKLDFTPFISYFIENVYNQLNQLNQENQIENTTVKATKLFENALKGGKITEKEHELFLYVVSNYANERFSTKQLERDFNNAAYATIRSFVLKFEKLGILTSEKYSNRVKYRIIQ